MKKRLLNTMIAPVVFQIYARESGLNYHPRSIIYVGEEADDINKQLAEIMPLNEFLQVELKGGKPAPDYLVKFRALREVKTQTFYFDKI